MATLLTQEVAAALKISRTRLLGLISRGIITAPPKDVSGRFVFTAEQVEAAQKSLGELEAWRTAARKRKESKLARLSAFRARRGAAC